MFAIHPNIVTPSDETKVWRYMNLSSFLWMLDKKSLYFTRFRQLPDANEGKPYAYLSKKLADFPPDLHQQIAYLQQKVVDSVIVSCWHENNHESIAMWALYNKGIDGVAVGSSIGALKRAVLGGPGPLNIGRVNYLDYQSETDIPAQSNIEGINTTEPIFCKSLSYKHEAEVRLAFVMPETAPPFRRVHTSPILPVGAIMHSANQFVRQEVPVNLETLIEDVIVSPNFPEYEIEPLQRILSASIPKVAIKISGLKT